MANRSEVLTTVVSYVAEDAITKNGFVKQGTGAHQVLLPTASSSIPVGIALDDAAAGEEVAVLTEGRTWVIDMDGTLNTGDGINVGDGAAEYHKAVLAVSGAAVAGVVVGEDAAAADDLVLVEISSGYKPVMA